MNVATGTEENEIEHFCLLEKQFTIGWIGYFFSISSWFVHLRPMKSSLKSCLKIVKSRKSKKRSSYPVSSPGSLILSHCTTVTSWTSGYISGAENFHSFITQILPARKHQFQQIHIPWQHMFFCGGF